MNLTLIRALLLQRMLSPVRICLVVAFFLFPLMLAAFEADARMANMDYVFVLILGAGMVGQDVTSGVLQGLLARPVRRSEYLVSRWLAVALGSAFLTLLLAALGYLIAAARGNAADLGPVAVRACEGVLTDFGVAAVLAFFSSWMNGLGDLAVFLMASLGAQLCEGIGSIKPAWEWVARVGREFDGCLSPRLDLTQALGPGVSAFAVVSYFSTVTLCLALAIVILNRRELSYASG
ncbi:MAG TPA: hypothetical protein VMS93_09150 [Candidatus Saccharimonadales bacterium]|nr:hypothetical protein [Candidatus Saccharimonadales bacterium]